MRSDRTVAVQSDQPGYREIVEFSRRLSELLSCSVHVITDELPAAADAEPM